jgi:hypothetical protein
MAKPKSAAAAADKIERWKLVTDYVEACNCNFGCPCNFSGYPTDGYCEAIVGYHIRDGNYGRTKLGGIDVIYVAAWPKAIHQGGGTLRLYVSESATEPQREAIVRIFRGLAKGSGPFELFATTMATIEDTVFAPIEFVVDERRSRFRVPGVVDVAMEPFVNPVSGEEQDVRVNLPKGFIWRSVKAAKTTVMRILGTGSLSFDHAGQNAFYARLEFAGP